MSIIMHCRHCENTIGTLPHDPTTERKLGIHTLSKDEQEEMIAYHENGNVYVQSICESCEETLKKYPEFHALPYFIQ